MISKIEQNALGHFMCLPKAAGFSVITDGALTIINCGLGSSMFNIAYGGFDSAGTDFDRKVRNVIDTFNGQPFAWWVPPSAHSPELTQKLLSCGFAVEAAEHAMLCDLNDFERSGPKTDLIIEHVISPSQIEHFISVLEPYDVTVRSFYEKLTLYMLNGEEKLYVGYENGTPVIIGILYFQGDAAGIFSLLTREDKRGLGFGAHMMTYLMQTAKESGAQYVTLSASSDSGFRIYERLGFKSFGHFECFEWKGS
jgi:GNAT superfamily N-acetyltransferase